MDMVTPKLELHRYQKALDNHHSKEGTIRALLIINPHNPLGVVFPPEDVIQLCNWATRNNLMVLIDESFSSCVFGSTLFKSFLCYRHQLEKPSRAFYIWSMSKDFGIPGLKMSVVHTSSSELITSLSCLEFISPVSALSQSVASNLLSDFDRLRKFHALKLAKLSAHYKFLTKQLCEIGLNFTPAVAGCFIMVDFRKHLRSATFADELSLFQSLCDKGLMLTPGQHILASQPGWMRIVFTCGEKELVEGANRLRAFLNFSSVNNTIDY
ncbi:aminotransferase, class I/II [Dictyocaulus viviparus]|uniref:Aminotransferase, class I/II n=1 Tax=Dictyocaulus viviparus TaxID=29172 RepID=A0A0D8XN79_DICVI|nr:aminotransferase, class I/II [Dictyocaulus viviparus]